MPLLPKSTSWTNKVTRLNLDRQVQIYSLRRAQICQIILEICETGKMESKFHSFPYNLVERPDTCHLWLHHFRDGYDSCLQEDTPEGGQLRDVHRVPLPRAKQVSTLRSNVS